MLPRPLALLMNGEADMADHLILNRFFVFRAMLYLVFRPVLPSTGWDITCKTPTLLQVSAFFVIDSIVSCRHH
jgi:hypothetical protein